MFSWLLLFGACGDPETIPSETFDPGPEPVICEVPLPAVLWVIRGEEDARSPGTVAWLCGGANVTVDAVGGAFFVEADAQITLNAADARVYARDGATVTANADGIDLSHEPDATLTINADVEQTACDEIIFDTDDTVEQCD